MSTRKRPHFYGWNPPFFGGQQGVMSRQEDERLIKNDILQLIMTSPGERVMRSNFGSGVRLAVFEQITPQLLTNLEDSIATAILDEEPRVQLHSVVVEEDANNNRLNIKIVVSLKREPQNLINVDAFINLPTGT